MENIRRCTKELKKAICDSEAYQNFETAKEKMRQQPELRKKLQRFRRKNFVLQNSEGGSELYEQIQIFEKENEKFRENPLVKEYLDSELEMCRMLQRITHSIMATVDLEIDDFMHSIDR